MRPFRNRSSAGAALARALGRYRAEHVLVLGIPRGGVPVAAEVARSLGADLDIVVARKLGSPNSEELAIGAVTADGGRFINEDLVAQLGVSDAYLDEVTAAQIREARQRERRLRGSVPKQPLAGRVAIVVDDGLATGATMRAAIHAVLTAHPSLVVGAVPVGAAETCAELRTVADDVVCLLEVDHFLAVGAYYQDFAPVADAEVSEILAHWAAERAREPRPG